jgi:hypothetical protein
LEPFNSPVLVPVRSVPLLIWVITSEKKEKKKEEKPDEVLQYLFYRFTIFLFFFNILDEEPDNKIKHLNPQQMVRSEIDKKRDRLSNSGGSNIMYIMKAKYHLMWKRKVISLSFFFLPETLKAITYGLVGQATQTFLTLFSHF